MKPNGLEYTRVIDMLNVEDVLGKLKSLKEFPDIVILHRGIDQESGRTCGLERIKMIRQAFPNKKFLIAVAGGIVPETAKEALEQGADILIVGRYVTQSKDIERSVRDFLELTPSYARRHRLIQSPHRINPSASSPIFSFICLLLFFICYPTGSKSVFLFFE